MATRKRAVYRVPADLEARISSSVATALLDELRPPLRQLRDIRAIALVELLDDCSVGRKVREILGMAAR